MQKGGRVHHKGRDDYGTIEDVLPNGTIIVVFDKPTPRGKVSRGEFDRDWFRVHPDMMHIADQ